MDLELTGFIFVYWLIGAVMWCAFAYYTGGRSTYAFIPCVFFMSWFWPLLAMTSVTVWVVDGVVWLIRRVQR